MSFSTFVRYYELARLDMTRHWLTKGWAASMEGESTLGAVLEESIYQIDGGTVLSSAEEYKNAIKQFE